MLSKLNSRFWATSISVAALSIGLAFSQQATQKASAQTAGTDDPSVQIFRDGETDFVITNTPVDPQDDELRVTLSIIPTVACFMQMKPLYINSLTTDYGLN